MSAALTPRRSTRIATRRSHSHHSASSSRPPSIDILSIPTLKVGEAASESGSGSGSEAAAAAAGPETEMRSRHRHTRRDAHPVASPRESLLDLADGTQPTPTLVNLAVSLILWRIIDMMWTHYENGEPLVDWTWALEQLGGYNLIVPAVINQIAFAFMYSIYGLEKLNASSRISSFTALNLYYIIIACILAVPLLLLRLILPDYSAVAGCAVSMQSAIHVLKAHSYFWTNRELEKHSKIYPGNLTLSDYTFWSYIPTFCYYPQFPRSPKRRWWYIFKELFLMMFSFFIFYFTLVHDVFPVLPLVPRHPFQWGSLYTTSRLLVKLGIPMLILITSFFTGLFHAMMNMIAEFHRFADHTSYKDWWNVNGMTEFWQKWNYRVHEWTLRHLYAQTREQMDLHPTAAMIVSFTVSALFHEYIFFVSFKRLQFWTSAVMLSQIALMWVMKGDIFHKTSLGNFVMLVGIPLGLGVLLCVCTAS